MKKRIFLLFIISLLFIVGCGSKKRVEYKAKVSSFFFNYTLDKETCNYSISREGNFINFVSYGNKTSCNNSKQNIDEEYLNKLNDIIKEYELTKWDEYREEDVENTNGDNYSLQMGFEDGKNIFSYGYNELPDNYNEVKTKLIELFNSIMKD